jgi:hypothetical protein
LAGHRVGDRFAGMKQQQDVSQHGKVVTRQELYEAVWSKTLKALAEEWKTPHEQLLLACKKMDVPRPNQRYWPLISWGHRGGRKPLPRRSRKTPGELMLPARGRARGALAVETSATEQEWRRLAETRELEERRRIEEQRRKVLVGRSEAWFKARRLRRFVRACEAAVRDGGGAAPASGWPQAWLAWAREQADRLDPLTNGFLEAERERFAGGAGG